MKVLLIHNYLRPPSGENTVFDAEKELLLNHHRELATYEKSNYEIEKYSLIKKLKIPLHIFWSLKSYKEIKRLIKTNRPDIAHFHNTFPLVSPSAYFACKDEGVPVVQTLHNHRLFCPGGYFLRNGKICKDCVEKGLRCSINNACYHDSKIQTAGLAAMLYIHRKLETWNKRIDCYITLTKFAKELYSNAGLPEDKISIKPNFIHDLKAYKKESVRFGVFIGRLGVEKGVESLLHALRKTDNLSFKLLGDGPLRNSLEDIKSKLNLKNLEFCGYKSREETISILGKASFLVLPAIYYEGFPMVILEAMSLGKPVITTDLGGLPEIIRDGYNGFIVPSGDINVLSEKMNMLVKDKATCEMMGQNARKEYETKYTPEKNYEMLMDIYKKVIERSARKNV